MTLHLCQPDARIVGATYWLPEAPFDYAWTIGNPAIGCNNLVCHACGERVQVQVVDEFDRLYRCACQERVQSGRLILGSDEGQVREFRTEWRCDGHPSLSLPTRLDGIDLAAIGPTEEQIANAFAHPPFVPPDTDSPSFWVGRLYSLLSDDLEPIREKIGRTVAKQLFSDDAWQVRCALSFFFTLPNAPGSEALPSVARARGEFFRKTTDPVFKNCALEDPLYDLLLVRAGGLGDAEARALVHEALLAGREPGGALVRSGVSDSAWLAAHAGKLARLRPDWAFDLVFAIHRATKLEVVAALEAIASISPEAATAARESIERYYMQYFPSDVIEEMLAVVDRAKDGRG